MQAREVAREETRRTSRMKGSVMVLLLCVVTVAAMFFVILQDDSVHTVSYQLSEEKEAAYYDHTMYAAAKEELYTVDLSDGKVSEVTSLPVYQTIALDYGRERIYYSFGNSLYQCSFNKGEVVKLYTCQDADALHCMEGTGDNLCLMTLSAGSDGIQTPQQVLVYEKETHSVKTTKLNPAVTDQILYAEGNRIVYLSKTLTYGGICTYDIDSANSKVLVFGTKEMELKTIKQSEIVEDMLCFLSNEGELFTVLLDGTEAAKSIQPPKETEFITNFCFAKNRCFLLTRQPDRDGRIAYEYDMAAESYHKFHFVFPKIESSEPEVFFYDDSKLYYKAGYMGEFYCAELPFTYR